VNLRSAAEHRRSCCREWERAIWAASSRLTDRICRSSTTYPVLQTGCSRGLGAGQRLQSPVAVAHVGYVRVGVQGGAEPRDHLGRAGSSSHGRTLEMSLAGLAAGRRDARPRRFRWLALKDVCGPAPRRVGKPHELGGVGILRLC